MKDKKYIYRTIENCNMCGTSSDNFKVMGKRLNQPQGYRPNRLEGVTTSVLKCKNCGLIFTNPLPIPENIDDHYGIEPEKYWREEYFQFNQNYFKGGIEWLKRFMKINQDTKSLDIGAGLGKQMLALQGVGFDAFGIEPSSSFYTLAIEKMNISPERLQNLSLEDATFKRDFFDFISFGAVLEHIYDPSSALKKALSWLKPGGFIHIEVPNSNWLISKILNAQYKIRGLDYVTNLSPMHPPYHLYEFDIESFKINGKINGYTVKDYTYFVCRTTLPKVFDPFLRPYMKNTNTGMQLCLWLENKNGFVL